MRRIYIFFHPRMREGSQIANIGILLLHEEIFGSHVFPHSVEKYVISLQLEQNMLITLGLENFLAIPQSINMSCNFTNSLAICIAQCKQIKLKLECLTFFPVY